VSGRLEAIRDCLQQALSPLELQVVDDSHRHVGHEGARDGRGHFSVRIVSASFEGQPLLARHRLVYDALGALMQTDIHALALKAIAPSES
jgi:BolA protein